MGEKFLKIQNTSPLQQYFLLLLYTLYQENQYFVKNMLLLKNPQFYPNHYETLSKGGPNEDFIFTKFRYDWVKIVDFLIKAYL